MSRYYIKQRGAKTNLMDVTFLVMRELDMPSFFRWDFYEIVCE